MYFVQVARRILVQDDDVSTQTFQPPVLLGLQDLAHETDIVIADDPHEQDR